jgi:hypothetical protein
LSKADRPPFVEQPDFNGAAEDTTLSQVDMNGTAFHGVVDTSLLDKTLVMNGMNGFHALPPMAAGEDTITSGIDVFYAPPPVNNMNGRSVDNVSSPGTEMMQGGASDSSSVDHNVEGMTNTMNEESADGVTPTASTTPALTTVNAEFYFGLVTESYHPNNLDGYLGSVKTMLQAVMANTKATDSDVRIETPSVKDVKRDGTE